MLGPSAPFLDRYEHQKSIGFNWMVRARHRFVRCNIRDGSELEHE